MANNTIDTLSIQITSSSQGATVAINKLIGNLEKLNGALELYSDDSNKYTRAMNNIATGVTKLNSAINGINSDNLRAAANSIKALADASTKLNNAFANIDLNKTGIANNLKSLSGVTVPDFSGVATLAANVSKLGNKGATQGAANIPLIAQGLQSLSGLQIPDFPNLDSLNNLIASLNKLGGKKGTSAATNIQPLINGLQQLSALSNVTFPDANNLMQLANAFSALGRGTTSEAIQNIPQLAVAFRNLMVTLSNAPTVSRNVIDLANALARLASQGSKVGSATDSMTRQINKMTSVLYGINAKAKSISNSIFNFGKNLVSSARQATSASKSYSNLASKVGLLYAKFWLLLRVASLFNKMISVASALTEVQNVVDTTFGRMTYKIEDFSKNAIKSFGMSELAAKQFASRFQAMGNAMGITGQQVAKAQQLISTKTTSSGLAAGYDKASNSMADMSINLTKLTADMASFYDVEQEVVAKALQSGVMAGQTRPLRQYGIDLTNATLSEWAMNNGLNANIKAMSQAEKTMLRYQYVMAQTTNAQGDFTRTAKTWHNSVVVLKQQLIQLAAVIGSGLIQALKPFVNAMNNALSGLITFAQNVVNALGKIFGWEMEVNTSGLSLDEDAYDVDTSGLEDVADAAGDAGKATDGAAKSAKKLKEQLQGFDKLNVIRSQDTSDTGGSGGGGSGGKGGSGGGGGGGASGGEVSASIKKTKSMFESDIDDLYELGKYIGDALSDAMDSIPWEKVYKKAEGFGKGLAEFLNGLFADNPKLFDKLGKTVAGCINTALIFLDSFGKTFHWNNFGKSLATGLNSFLKNMKWDKYLSAASTWGKGLGDTLAGFLTEADFVEVGKAVGTFIKGQVVFFLSLGSSIPWSDVGTSLADTINGAIETFPAKELAQTINVWVQGIWDLLTTAIKNVDKEKLISKIKEFIGALDFKTIAIVVSSLALIKGASLTVAIGSAIVSKVAEQFVAKLAAQILVKMAGSKALETAIGGGLGKAAEKSIGKGTLVGQVSADSGSIIKNIAGIGTAVVGLGTTSTGFYKLWNEGWTTSSGVMVGAGTGMTLAGLGIAGVLTGPLALAIAGASAAFALFAANHEKIIGGIKKQAGELGKSWNDLKEDAKRAFGGVDGTVTNTNKNYKTNSSSIITLSGNMGSKVSKNVTNMKKNTTSSFSSMNTESNKKTAALKTSVSKHWDEMKATADDKIGSKKNKKSLWSVTQTGFGNVAKDGASKVGGIKKDVNSVWASVGTNAEKNISGSGKNTVKGKVVGAFNDVKASVKKQFPFSLGQVCKDIELPVITVNKKEKMGVKVAQFGVGKNTVNKYAKAYDTPYVFTQSTLVPSTSRMFGDGNGGEMVYGHANLMNDIREASGGTAMTDIGNRQLANDQKIIKLLTVIAEKEFGISEDAVFRAARSGASNYTMRTGRSAFDF